MKFSVRSIMVALALMLGATVLPSAGRAQTFYGGGGGVVAVRDHGHGWHRGDGPRGWRGDHRRPYYRDRFHGGPRYYRSGPRYGRDRSYYGHRRHYRDRQYFGRRHYRDSGVVIRLR